MEDLLINHFITCEEFRRKHQIRSLEIDDDDLRIIYHLIANNRFVLTNEHYLPVLLHSVKEKTSLSTSLKLKNLFKDYHSIFLNV